MNEAFGWIGQLVHWVASFLPTYIHVLMTHEGVFHIARPFCKPKYKKMGPGLHWYISAWTQPYTFPVVRQTLKLPSQTLTFWDTDTEVVSVTLTVVVTYEIQDITKALIECSEFDETVTETAQGAVKRTLLAKSWTDVIQQQLEIDKELTRKIRSSIKKYGAHVIEVAIVDFFQTKGLRIIGDEALVDVAEDEE